MDPDTQMGPLVSEEQLNRVTGFLDSGKTEGATAVTGAKRGVTSRRQSEALMWSERTLAPPGVAAYGLGSGMTMLSFRVDQRDGLPATGSLTRPLRCPCRAPVALGN